MSNMNQDPQDLLTSHVATETAQKALEVNIDGSRYGTFSEIGAGLQISPNGFAVLRALGLGEAVRAGGIAAHRNGHSL